MKIINTTIFLMILILLTGCRSFVSIEKNEFKNIMENDVITVWLQDGRCIEKINVQKATLSDSQLEIVDKNSQHSVFLLKDVNDILVNKYNYPLSIITGLGAGLVTVAVIFIVMITSNPPGKQ